MAIILSPEADVLSVTVHYQHGADQVEEFVVELQGTEYSRLLKADIRRNAKATEGVTTKEAAAEALMEAINAEAESETDPWRRDATGDARTLDTCLVGWDGVHDGTGSEVPFTPETKRQLLGLPGMATAITIAASDELAEVEAKNLRGWPPKAAASTRKSRKRQ